MAAETRDRAGGCVTLTSHTWHAEKYKSRLTLLVRAFREFNGAAGLMRGFEGKADDIADIAGWSLERGLNAHDVCLAVCGRV